MKTAKPKNSTQAVQPFDEAAKKKREARIAAALGEYANLPAVVPSRASDTMTREQPEAKTAVNIYAKKGETDAHALARTAVSPAYTGAAVANAFSKFNENIGINEAVEVFDEMAKSVQDGSIQDVEAMLVSQSIALNSIFTLMARRGAHNMKTNFGKAEAFMRMAFKAQNQCRSTLETLGEIKNPRQATFVRQQNIANQQQINNGLDQENTASRTEEMKDISESNKLLTEAANASLDTRRTRAAGGVNQDMEVLGKIDRTSH